MANIVGKNHQSLVGVPLTYTASQHNCFERTQQQQKLNEKVSNFVHLIKRETSLNDHASVGCMRKSGTANIL